MRPHINYRRGKASAVARFEQAQAERGAVKKSTSSTEGRELNLAHRPGGFSVVSGTAPADSQGSTGGAKNRVGDGSASPELMDPKPVLKPGLVDTKP